MACIRCKVKGRVQGVWFRDSTRRKALSLDLTGYAVNLPGGSVEVIACGDPQMLAVLREWLWEGPELARVTSVDCVNIDQQDFEDFTIG